jgi:hypothetical protein
MSERAIPTQEAYDAACRALWQHRAEVARLLDVLEQAYVPLAVLHRERDAEWFRTWLTPELQGEIIRTALRVGHTIEAARLLEPVPTDTAGAAPAGDGGPATGTAEGRGDDGAQSACSE